MPEVIDLISSDPPLPDKQLVQKVYQPSHQHSNRHPSNLGLISSDPIDDSLFTYDDLHKSIERRKVTTGISSSLRKAAVTHENVVHHPDSLFQFSDDDFALPPSNPAALKGEIGEYAGESDPVISTSPMLDPERFRPSLPGAPVQEPSDIITLDDDDDDELLKATGNKSTFHFTQSSIEEFSDPPLVPEFSDMIVKSHTGKSGSVSVFSSKTARLLSDLSATRGSKKGGLIPNSCTEIYQGVELESTATYDLADEVDEPPKPRRLAKRPSKITTEEKEAKVNAKAEAKAQKERERQLEKERKQQIREEKAKQKQLAADIAEVNKLKVGKKDSTSEMILDLASSLEETSVGNQTLEFMKRLGVEYAFFASSIPNVVKWRRKMKAKFNEAAGHWQPCPFYVQEEKHVLCLVTAQDFVDLAIQSPGQAERDTLERHVVKIKNAYPGCKLIYLIEGLTTWMRKNRTSRNRAFQAEVLRQNEQPTTEPPPSTSTASRSRGRKPKNNAETTPPVDDDTIEDALLTLQVTHSCLVHHSNAPAESAEWIKNFTEHISTIPYRRELMDGNDSAFCMDTGQVKTGEDKFDTFIKMLQEVNRITAPIAYGIAQQYPNVSHLVHAMHLHGPTTLEDVKVSVLVVSRLLSCFLSFHSTTFI